jgi:hypothetical protein
MCKSARAGLATSTERESRARDVMRMDQSGTGWPLSDAG